MHNKRAAPSETALCRYYFNSKTDQFSTSFTVDMS